MVGLAKEDEIVAALKSEPLCEKIVRFLIEHDGAMDTIRGVAGFWAGSDEVAVKSALDRLVAAGVIITQSLSSGAYYSLTRDANVRAWLHGIQSTLLPGPRPLCENGSTQTGAEVGDSV
jgi:hypothetical protein